MLKKLNFLRPARPGKVEFLKHVPSPFDGTGCASVGGMRTIVLASLCVSVLGCGDDNNIPGGNSDLAVPSDAARGPDLVAAFDLSATGDLAGPPADLATRVDLAIGLGDPCGGFRGQQCPAQLFCDIPDGCGFADQTGVCRARPQVCDKVLDPVCGCDGTQYGNDCERQQAGVSLYNKGICGCDRQCGPTAHCEACKGGPACVPNGAAC